MCGKLEKPRDRFDLSLICFREPPPRDVCMLVRTLDVNRLKSHSLICPKCQLEASIQRISRANLLGRPQSSKDISSFEINSWNLSTSGKSPSASAQFGTFGRSTYSPFAIRLVDGLGYTGIGIPLLTPIKNNRSRCCGTPKFAAFNTLVGVLTS